MRKGLCLSCFVLLKLVAWNCSNLCAQQSYPNTGEVAYPQTTAPAPVPPGQLPVPVALSSGQPVTTSQPGVAAPQQFVGPPFQLSEVEQQYVDQILQQWEDRGADVKTFDCEFERWEYDPVFGPGNNEPSIKSNGRLTYSKPDKGSFRIEDVYRYVKGAENEPAEYKLQEHEIGEHWVCDGKAVYNYNQEKKQLEVQKLPEDMRGTDIVNGPLPFLFGAEAEKLKARYWIRSKQSNAATIWLEAYPRTQADAANYHHVEVMLDRATMLPKGLQVHMPNGNSRAVYIFKTPTVNGTIDKLFGGLFNAPRTPFGWKKVVIEAPTQQPMGPQATNPQGAPQQR